MYYIAVSSIGAIGLGESVLVTRDELFDEVSVMRPSGEVVGFVSSFWVEGCLSKEFLRDVTNKEQGITAEVLLKSGDVLILATEGRYKSTQHINTSATYRT